MIEKNTKHIIKTHKTDLAADTERDEWQVYAFISSDSVRDLKIYIINATWHSSCVCCATNCHKVGKVHH
jgi:hypothetical protein